jgi:hypothetical protein
MDFEMNFVPLDSDVLSMELPMTFSDCQMWGDRTDLYSVASGIMQLQVLSTH